MLIGSMATLKGRTMTISNDYPARVASAMTRLGEMTAALVQAEKASAPVKDILAGLRKMANSAPTDEVGALAVVEALGENLDAVAAIIDDCEGVLKLVGGNPTADRTEGDALVKMLTAGVEGEMIDGGDAEKVAALTSAWHSVGKGSGSGKGRPRSGESKGNLAFPVRISCEACQGSGKPWSAQQSTDLNSVRWAAVLHHEKCHGGRFARGEAVHNGVTEALGAVIDNGAEHAQGGGYLVDKVSAVQ